MTRASFLHISLAALAASCADSPTIAAPPAARPPLASLAAAAPPSNPVVQWNRALLRVVRTPGVQSPTVHPTRSFAILHAAIFDAVNAIDQTHEPYRVRLTGVAPGASPDAAVAAAAHEALVALYPSLAAQLDEELRQSLADIPDGDARREGLRVGKEVAGRILALRRDDGSAARPVVRAIGDGAGDYRPTPPDFPAQPQFTHWARVTPFALRRASQFRPHRPPALTSPAYADAVNEVRSLGTATGTDASADEALTGRFWNGPIQDYWNEIAQDAALSRHLTTAETARLFGLLDLTLADCVIAFYDAKYTYSVWRPVTAIRAAGADHNAETDGDTTWLPAVGKTPPDPSYPGAHAVISAAAAAVLTSFFRTDHVGFTVTSATTPGVERRFTTLSGAEREATFSRVFAGVHFRFDLTAGERLGHAVAGDVLAGLLTPSGAGHKRR
jgi:hypothetical protein